MGDKGLFPFTPDEILGSCTEAFISESKSQSLVRELGKGERWESRHREDWHQATETLTMCQRELCSWNDGGSLCSSSPTTPHPPEQNSRANRSLKNGREKGRPATETKPKLCVCVLFICILRIIQLQWNQIKINNGEGIGESMKNISIKHKQYPCK